MASAWGASWGSAWASSWGSVGTSTAQTFTSSGRRHGATQWAYKTLGQIEREKKRELARAMRAAEQELKEAVASGITDENALLALAKTEIREAEPRLTRPIVDELTPRLFQLIRIIVAARIEAEEEDDLDALLLAI